MEKYGFVYIWFDRKHKRKLAVSAASKKRWEEFRKHKNLNTIELAQ